VSVGIGCDLVAAVLDEKPRALCFTYAGG